MSESMSALREALQRTAHFLDVQGRPEMAHTCREAAEQLFGLAEQLAAVKTEALGMAEAMERAMDTLENWWNDPARFREDEQ